MTNTALTNGIELVDPAYYGKNGPPHDLWTELRERNCHDWAEHTQKSKQVEARHPSM